MRYLLPLGALILIAAGVWIHRSPVESQAPRPQSEKPAEIRVQAAIRPVEVDAPIREAAPQGGSPLLQAAEATVPAKPAASFEWKKLSGTLERSLELGPLQQSRVERILRQRQDDIRVCHEEIRKSGILDIRAYEWKVRGWKEEWYRSIDAVLDRSQHQRFIALVEGGLFNEGLAFTVEPGITVLE